MNFEDDEYVLPPLLLATLQRNKQKMEEILLADGDNSNRSVNDRINATDSSSHTSLWVAAYDGDPFIVDLLLTYGADTNIRSTSGTSPLFVAAQNGHLEVVEQLTTFRDHVHLPDENGVTPLLVACENGHFGIVELLVAKMLSRRYSPNRMTKDGITPIWIASAMGNLKIVEYLFQMESKNDFYEDREGYWQNRHVIVKASSAFGVGGNGAFGNLIQVSRRTQDLSRIKDNERLNPDDFKSWLMPDHSGRTPLFAAVQCGHTEVVGFLLERGCDPNHPDSRGTTPIYVAVQNGHVDITDLLLSFGSNPNASYSTDRIPLHDDHDNEDEDENNGNTNDNDNDDDDDDDDDNNNPINDNSNVRGKKNNNPPKLEKSRQGINDLDLKGVHLLYLAAYFRNIDIFRVLLSNGASFDYLRMNDFTELLSCVAIAGDVNLTNDIIEFIKEKYEDPLEIMDKPDHLGFSALEWAVQHGHDDVVRLLADHGANPYLAQNVLSVRNKYPGFTRLHKTVWTNDSKHIKMKAKEWWDSVNSRSSIYNRTPLHHALLFGYIHWAVKLLYPVSPEAYLQNLFEEQQQREIGIDNNRNRNNSNNNRNGNSLPMYPNKPIGLLYFDPSRLAKNKSENGQDGADEAGWQVEMPTAEGHHQQLSKRDYSFPGNNNESILPNYRSSAVAEWHTIRRAANVTALHGLMQENYITYQGILGRSELDHLNSGIGIAGEGIGSGMIVDSGGKGKGIANLEIDYSDYVNLMNQSGLNDAMNAHKQKGIANTNIADSTGWTQLHELCASKLIGRSKKLRLAKLLLEKQRHGHNNNSNNENNSDDNIGNDSSIATESQEGGHIPIDLVSKEEIDLQRLLVTHGSPTKFARYWKVVFPRQLWFLVFSFIYGFVFPIVILIETVRISLRRQPPRKEDQIHPTPFANLMFNLHLHMNRILSVEYAFVLILLIGILAGLILMFQHIVLAYDSNNSAQLRGPGLGVWSFLLLFAILFFRKMRKENHRFWQPPLGSAAFNPITQSGNLSELPPIQWRSFANMKITFALFVQFIQITALIFNSRLPFGFYGYQLDVVDWFRGFLFLFPNHNFHVSVGIMVAFTIFHIFLCGIICHCLILRFPDKSMREYRIEHFPFIRADFLHHIPYLEEFLRFFHPIMILPIIVISFTVLRNLTDKLSCKEFNNNNNNNNGNNFHHDRGNHHHICWGSFEVEYDRKNWEGVALICLIYTIPSSFFISAYLQQAPQTSLQVRWVPAFSVLELTFLLIAGGVSAFFTSNAVSVTIFVFSLIMVLLRYHPAWKLGTVLYFRFASGIFQSGKDKDNNNDVGNEADDENVVITSDDDEEDDNNAGAEEEGKTNNNEKKEKKEKKKNNNNNSEKEKEDREAEIQRNVSSTIRKMKVPSNYSVIGYWKETQYICICIAAIASFTDKFIRPNNDAALGIWLVGSAFVILFSFIYRILRDRRHKKSSSSLRVRQSEKEKGIKDDLKSPSSIINHL